MQNQQKNKEHGQLSIDIYETASQLLIVAPIAGVTLEEINVSVTEDVLTIKGERKFDQKIADDNLVIQECFWGEFSRSIVLPTNVDSTKIQASFKNSILTISMPRSERTRTKVVKIKT